MADYSINAVKRRVVLSGSAGVGPYAFTFEIIDNDDIAVYKNTTLLTLTTDYTVTINANGTGSVTLVTAAVADDDITIIGARDIERTTDFVTAGDLKASSLNEQLDAQVIFTQQVDERVDRALKGNFSDPTDLDYTIPAVDDRKGKYLAFNSTTGAPEAGASSDDVATLASVTDDIATLADIEDGTDDTDAIQNVAAIASDVSTVSGISSNVSTVAGISADVTAVAGDATDIGAVAAVATEIGRLGTADAVSDLNTLGTADAVSDMNTLAAISSDITSVAGKASLITSDFVSDLNQVAVADVISDINTLATSDIVTDLNLLATSDFVADLNTMATAATVADLDTLADISSDITTAAGVSANITTVAGQISPTNNIATVAGDSANIGTVAGDSANIGTLAGISSDITTVAGVSTEIGRLGTADAVADMNTLGTADVVADLNTLGTADVVSDMNTLAAISANITTVAGDSADIGTLAAISSDITTASSISSDITTVSTNNANVTTVASNITGVNSFAERYRVGASDPTTSLDEGDLFFNTTDNGYKFYDGSAWQTVNVSGIGNVSEDTTPELGGDLSTSGNDINFGDNDKAQFGAGNDLQIYHNGSNSYVEDAGTGVLVLKSNGTGTYIQNTSNNNIISALGSEARLHYDGSVKLATTTTGVDVTGTITSDGLTVDGGITTTTSAVALDVTEADSGSDAIIGIVGNGSGRSQIRSTHTLGTSSDLRMLTRDSGGTTKERIKINDNGDISFYADNGTTQGLYWDASTQRLGLGTTGPSTKAHFFDATNNVDLRIQTDKTNGQAQVQFMNDARQYNIGVDNADRFGIYDATAAASRMTITSGGNVGIGTTSPTDILHVKSSGGSGYIKLDNSSGGERIFLGSEAGISAIYSQTSSGGNQPLKFATGSSERMRIDSSGNLLVGKTDTSTASQGCVLGAGGLTSFNRDDNVVIRVRRDGTNGEGIEFYNDSSKVGSISLGASGTTYNTTSDIRLKTDIAPIADATDKLMAMNAVTHKWKADPDADAVVGFIAQEMAEIVPEAVSKGEGEDGMWSMDYGRITPVLVAALQDAHRKIEQLEQRINEMEAE